MSDEPIKCRACPHPPHTETCTAQLGGTAYACGCIKVTPKVLHGAKARIYIRSGDQMIELPFHQDITYKPLT